jgi:hypothetical protein
MSYGVESLLVNSLNSTKRDSLKWWADHATKFLILASLALQYLAIPATSAPSERLCGIATRIITKGRTSILEVHAECMPSLPWLLRPELRSFQQKSSSSSLIKR